MRKLLVLLMIIPALVLAQPNNAGIPAFPGAQGFGMYATGGRGAAQSGLYIINSLSDDNTVGTLRHFLTTATGARIGVPIVSGIANFASTRAIASDDSVTLLANLSPGGIEVMNGKVAVNNSNNVIIRGLKCRVGDDTGDDFALTGTQPSARNAFEISQSFNVIVDHCTVQWGINDCFQVGDAGGTKPSRITVQNCLIGMGLDSSVHPSEIGGNSKSLNFNDSDSISIRDNLFVHSSGRNPQYAIEVIISKYSYGDMIGNVTYNWRSFPGDIGEKSGIIIMGNTMIPGPDLGAFGEDYTVSASNFHPRYFAKYNIGIGRNNHTESDFASFGGSEDSTNQFTRVMPFYPYPYRLRFGRQVEYVLQNAGAFPRDVIDAQIIRDVQNGTGNVVNSNFTTTKWYPKGTVTANGANGSPVRAYVVISTTGGLGNSNDDRYNGLPMQIDWLGDGTWADTWDTTFTVFDWVDNGDTIKATDAAWTRAITNGVTRFRIGSTHTTLPAPARPSYDNAPAYPTDTDNDGCPDYFELEIGSDPGVADSMSDHVGRGYTNIEEYSFTVNLNGFPKP